MLEVLDPAAAVARRYQPSNRWSSYFGLSVAPIQTLSAMQVALIQDLLIALALGLLVGLQREWSKSKLAGIRTFPLITAFGTLAMALGDDGDLLLVGAGLVAVAAMLAVGNLALQRRGSDDPGLTTEIATLVMYLVGAAVAAGFVAAATVTTGSVAVLLHWKGQLHGFVRRLEEAELRSAARLVLLAFVVLPALPDQGYGPYGVLNPFKVWLMVVLIVGISLAAYVAYRIFGVRSATLMAGVLGGLVSSTATTVTYAQKARENSGVTKVAVTVIVMASAIVFGRVLFEIALVAPATLATTGPPIAVMMALMLALAWAAHLQAGVSLGTEKDLEPPSTIRIAIAFGSLYAVVLLAVAAAREYLGSAGLYMVAALSGLTDVDAITLSTTQLVADGNLAQDVAWRLILVGALANLVFKGAIAGILGPRGLLARLAGFFGVALAGGAALLAFWP